MERDTHVKTKDPEAGALLPVLERIAGALERIGDTSESMSRMADTVERLEALAQRYERLQKMAIWTDRFSKLESIITPDKLDTMKTMIDEFVLVEYRVEKFRELGVDGFEIWLKKILTTQRTYEYLFFARTVGDWPLAIGAGKNAPTRSPESLLDEDYAVFKWVHELVWDRDFRMVHLRQCTFYRDFAELVNAALLQQAKIARSKKQKILADEMELTTQTSRALVEFDRLHALPESSPERQAEFQFIIEKSGDPSNFQSFLYFWVTYPNRSQTKAPKFNPGPLLQFTPRKPKK